MTRFTKPFSIIVLAALFGLSLLACVNELKDGTVPTELRGTWTGSGDAAGVSLTFTADSFTYNKGSSFYKVGSLVFTKATNTHPYTKTNYPSGYRFHGKYTDGSGNYAGDIGAEAGESVFLDANKARLCWDGVTGAQDWIFTKSN